MDYVFALIKRKTTKGRQHETKEKLSRKTISKQIPPPIIKTIIKGKTKSQMGDNHRGNTTFKNKRSLREDTLSEKYEQLKNK